MTDKNIGKEAFYKDYDGIIKKVKIKHLAFKNKTGSIIWYEIDFGYKAFIVDKDKLIFAEQLTLF